VRPLRASTDSDRWRVESSTGGFLRVSGRWDEGWRATVDGRSAAVLRADGIFRGVVVPPGRHTVQFHYANPDVERGLRLAVAALALIALVLVLSTRAAGQLPLMKRFRRR
jgi:uncharacterized membrane protein YfhO